ncbi:MBL fold metallo-hydrolase [Lacticaseibacillus brantae]|uniref:MBL fold metallo-hydrolase n=1 Tax=Lacticaseibacillus brantae TaxID=943673 RepID=UPI00070938C4|nr:MBL fold metallo-hydrolase [Lacticaseibacillus brantae]
MTEVRFLNGLDTIGGNIVEFSNGNSRVIMDFGVASDLTDETVESAIANGKLPNVPELFFNQPDKFDHEAIFISHLHIDHMGALQYLQADIPIYLSEPSYRLYQSLIAQGIEAPVDNLNPLPFETPVTIGDFTVTGFASDHDEPGVMALLVDDGRHRYGHSGDVRLNGPHRQNVDHWAQIFNEAKLSLFMLEGTTFSFDTAAPVEDQSQPSVPLSEASLQTAFAQTLEAASQLVVVNPYQRNYERLQAFVATAASQGRQMVFAPTDAKILEDITGNRPTAVLNDTVSLGDIKAEPAKFVLENQFANLELLAELPVSVYVHSNGEPLGDYDPRFQQLQDWLKAHNIPLQFLSASGHAFREDLITLAKMVNPKIIVPWHSFHPERMAETLDNETRAEVLMPERDLFYTIDEQ